MSGTPGPPALQDPPSVARRPADMRINGWYRALAIFLGLSGLGSGGSGVYVTHVEAGPVALLAVGLILLLVGIGGRLPSRLKFGDNEASWEEAAQQFVTRVAESTPPADRPEMLSALTDLAEAAPRVAAPALRAFAFEAEVMAWLPLAVSKAHVRAQSEIKNWRPHAPLVEWAGQGERWTVFDALIRSPSETQIGVTIKAYAGPVGREVVARVLDSAYRHRDHDQNEDPAWPPLSGVLVISRTDLTSAAQQELARSPFPAEGINVHSFEDIDRLATAVLSLWRKIDHLARAAAAPG